MSNVYLSLYFVLSRVFVLSKVAEVAWFRWVKMPVSISVSSACSHGSKSSMVYGGKGRIAFVKKESWFIARGLALVNVKFLSRVECGIV